MNELDDILNFCVNLARQMILAGANLERVHLAVEVICKTYHLQDISIFFLSSYISLGAYDSEGNYSSRQASIPPAGIHLEKLRSLNQLSYKVAEIKPNPKVLGQMLERAEQAKEYNTLIVLLGRICAMTFLSFIFGGTIREVFPVAAVTALMHFLMPLLENTGLDRIVINALTMFISTLAALAFVHSGFSGNLAVILITISMIVIPGIPLVNAMRNLLCGREINGILQMLKIVIETLALGMGMYVAIAFFGGDALKGAENTVPLSNPYLLVILSYAASIGFGIVFMIPPKDLWLAGLGGALARLALVTLTPVTDNRLLFVTLAAMAAALYAEFLAVTRRIPSTYFVYPSIIPLIPGDLFFFAIAGLYLGDKAGVEMNGINCLLSLAGLSIGFVLSSAVAHHIRRSHYKGLFSVPRQ
ncbi:MAG: threonine/serine exporter family protein [Synergistaceae bacterium]|nr:threonine/serine exporter family protein [Synergistaceae bacterium]